MGEFIGGDAAINRRGRPPGAGRKISQLKSVFNKLKKLSDKAIENVEKSVNGEVVDKDVLMSSKWVVNTLSTYHKAVLAEEEGLKIPADSTENNIQEQDEKPTSGFSLKMVK